MHEGTRVPQWSWDFLKAAFDCFPDLEYCIVLLPFSHQSLEFLQHFVVVNYHKFTKEKKTMRTKRKKNLKIEGTIEI